MRFLFTAGTLLALLLFPVCVSAAPSIDWARVRRSKASRITIRLRGRLEDADWSESAGLTVRIAGQVTFADPADFRYSPRRQRWTYRRRRGGKIRRAVIDLRRGVFRVKIRLADLVTEGPMVPVVIDSEAAYYYSVPCEVDRRVAGFEGELLPHPPALEDPAPPEGAPPSEAPAEAEDEPAARLLPMSELRSDPVGWPEAEYTPGAPVGYDIGPGVGDPAVDFELLDTDGREVRLSDLLVDGPVLLVIGSFT